MPAISTRQQQILDFLREYHTDRSYMPSIREIQLACGISSTSVVDYNLRLLERDGYIRRDPDISRA
ncbi:MAG: repressor LexA, partial [Chloroflexi bacterium]|nr:repressor LexA [Chloroflexota bacterium]